MSNSSSSSSDSAYIASLNALSTTISNNCLIVISAVGIPLNLVSLFIFSRPRLNKTNMGFLCSSQCVVDLILLVTTLLLTRGSTFVFGVSVYNASDFICKINTFFR